MSLEIIAKWRPLLEELVALGDVLVEAIQTSQPIAAIATMARMRKVRAQLSRIETTSSLAGTAEEAAEIASLQPTLEGVRRVEAVMDLWLKRPVPSDAELVKTPLGAAVIADLMLPTIWDYDNELVVLVGAGLEPVAEILRDLGQQRIILVGGDKLDGVIDVKTEDELTVAIRAMVPVSPTRAAVRVTAEIGHDKGEAIANRAFTALGDLRVLGNTIDNFSEVWIQHGAANMPAIAKWPTVGSLDGKFAGLPMVIVAPGPSLAKNAHLLAQLKGKAIITCFSRSLKPVVAAGVTPDLIVTADPQDLRYFFDGIDTTDSCLVNGVTVHPSLFDRAARALTMTCNGEIDRWVFGKLPNNAQVSGGGSVATNAFGLALRWKCDPIIFVGLDLSFPGGNYYVSGSADGNAKAVVEDGVMHVEGWSDEFHKMKAASGHKAPPERVVELPGWAGGTVQSSFILSIYHRWFVTQMKLVAQAGGTAKVYNCTEGGSFIEGMSHRPLAEVMSELTGSVDAIATIDETIANVDRTPRKHALASHLGDSLRALRRARRLANHARAVAHRDPAELARTEQELGKALEPVWFASLLAQRAIVQAHDVARRDGNAADYLAASIALFEAVIKVVDKIEPTLAKALDRMRSSPRSPLKRRGSSYDRP